MYVSKWQLLCPPYWAPVWNALQKFLKVHKKQIVSH